jgi:outer membrane lipoprotein-sorting protein
MKAYVMKKYIMKKFVARLSIVAFMVMMFSSLSAATSYTVDDVMNKTTATIKGNGAKSIAFSVSGSHAMSGRLIVYGKKFALSAGKSKSWYDGSSLTTYNPSTNEVTIVTPSASELTEANPLSYISLWKSQFKAAFSSKKISGSYVVVLTPKSSSSQVKKALLTVSKNNFCPQKLVVSMKSGGNFTVTVKSISSTPASASTFRFPKSQYKSAEIIDLR